jgi:hypothetical protein
MTGRPQSSRSDALVSVLGRESEQLEREDRRRYERFFRDVIRQRGFPLHTASLWNALFLGWDLETGDYLGRVLQATPVRSGPAIPVGSILEVAVGTEP